ncbi:hypothetical protein [Lysinibacillus fusiformis]|uniref:hypothetical protein n=1 Tax=Lysinibacillus fusiformis TaxID=28031 RepID=UPI0021BEDB40|nr:hypothetical protein [Lysinibacillus fusiformis]UXJ71359.1 hypothetical protein N5069_24280 [Lysinibacillus fusiformis]
MAFQTVWYNRKNKTRVIPMCPKCNQMKKKTTKKRVYTQKNGIKVIVTHIPAEECKCDYYITIADALTIETHLSKKTYNEPTYLNFNELM